MRRIINKFFVAVIVFSLTFTALPITAFSQDDSGSCGENVIYEYDGTKKILHITGTGKMADYDSTSDVPWYSYKNDIREIIIDDGITSIGSRCFYASSYYLKPLAMPDSITEIGYRAFCETNIHEITLSKNITTIGEEAFCNGYYISQVTIPSGVKVIPKSAFYGCRSLKTIVLNEGLEEIGDSAFKGCYGANVALDLPDSVTSIGKEAFANTRFTGYNVDSGNKNYCSVDGVLFTKDKKTLISYPASKSDTAYTIPDTTLYLAQSAFSYSVSLETVNFPNTIAEISTYCFNNSKIKEINFSDSIQRICSNAFYGCSKLTEVYLNQSIEHLDNQAFYACSSLTKVTVINEKCVFGDSNVINKTAEVYGYAGSTAETYASSNNLTFVALSEDCSVSHRFMNDEKYCLNDCGTENPDYSPIVAGKCTEDVSWSLNIETGLLTIDGTGDMTNNCIGRHYNDYSSLVKELTINEGITGMADFEKYKNVVTVNIPSSVKKLGGLRWDSSLKNVNLAQGVENLDDAFMYCTSLTSITIPEGCKTMFGGTFEGCSNLTEVIIPDSVEDMGAFTFYSCRKLSSIDLPENLTWIAPNMFTYCSSLTELTIPASVKEICGYSYVNGVGNTVFYEGEAFYGCSKLAEITVLGKDTEVWQDSSAIPSTIKIKALYESKAADYAKTYGNQLEYVCVDGTANHTYESSTTATCTEDGVKTYTCSLCEYNYDEDESAFGHSYASQVHSPTCTEQGYTEFICSSCADTYRTDYTDALGHNYTRQTYPPTCTEKGYIELVCSVCGDTYQDNYTDPIGHTFSDSEQYCLNECGEKNPDYKPATEDPVEEEDTHKTHTDYKDYRIVSGYKSVKIAWTHDMDLLGYQIYMSKTPKGKYKKIADIKTDSSSFYILNNLKSGSVYYFKLVGYIEYKGEIIEMNESRVRGIYVK